MSSRLEKRGEQIESGPHEHDGVGRTEAAECDEAESQQRRRRLLAPPSRPKDEGREDQTHHEGQRLEEECQR